MTGRLEGFQNHETTGSHLGALTHLLTIGVYAIRCANNNRLYIGSSANVAARTASHLSKLRAGKHICEALQADFQKYGETAFTFVLVETHRRIAEATAAEKRIILTHNPLQLYNTNTHQVVVPRPRPDAAARAALAEQYSYRPFMAMWSSLTALAADLEVSAECVRVMKMRDSISPAYWLGIVAAAKARGFEGVTLEALATIEAGKEGFLVEAIAA